jgi:large subunit ribosomal protein L6
LALLAPWRFKKTKEETMSRIGKKPVAIPAGVEVKSSGKTVSVKGPKGALDLELTGAISVEVDAATKEVRVGRDGDARMDRAKHGLYRALINNMIEGVTKGYAKSLEIQGVGYRAQLKGQRLELFVGYNTKVPEVYMIPTGVKVTVPTPTEINVEGIDKQLVGQVAASIRLIRTPDVYKGKGVRYKGEVVRKLPGKTVAASGS